MTGEINGNPVDSIEVNGFGDSEEIIFTNIEVLGFTDSIYDPPGVGRGVIIPGFEDHVMRAPLSSTGLQIDCVIENEDRCSVLESVKNDGGACC